MEVQRWEQTIKTRIFQILTAAEDASPITTGGGFHPQKREIRTKKGDANGKRFYTKINL